jgi:hypothetical protein
MTAIAQAKACAAGLHDRVKAVAVPAAGIDTLRPSTPFDGAYASFGALNCEPDLERLGAALASLIRPGGTFVCSIMGRYCPFEIGWFLLHGRPRLALRRLRPGWQRASVATSETNEVSVATCYLTARQLKQVFSPAFALERTLSLPLLLPPPYLNPLFQKHRTRFERLAGLERWLRQRWPWRLWGDHIVLVLRRQPSSM